MPVERTVLWAPTGQRAPESALPDSFACLEADPPWMERGGGKVKRGADRHYELLHAYQIVEVMMRSPVWRPDPDAHLYLWATSNHLLDALHVMDALGFRYVTQLVWVKERMGLGQYFRGRHELLLFGVRRRGRGTVHRTDARNIDSVLEAPSGMHSAKPAEAYALMEVRTAGDRCSMFSRGPCDGWWAWGSA